MANKIVGNFNTMPAAQIAEEAIKSVNDGEEARLKCTNIQRALNKRIKLSLYVNSIAVRELAIRAGITGV